MAKFQVIRILCGSGSNVDTRDLNLLKKLVIIKFECVLGHRFKTTYDFGFVALDILYGYAEDSGTYMCKARNAVGEAVTTCSVKVEGSHLKQTYLIYQNLTTTTLSHINAQYIIYSQRKSIFGYYG